MGFRQINLLRWNEGLGPDHVERVRTALDALPAAIPELRNYVHGPDIGNTEGNFDYAVVADFDSFEDFRNYQQHPAHTKAVHELILGCISERAAIQYET